MKVTGSRIKRIDMEGPSPVVVVDREAMEKTGYNSVADVLRDMTVNSFGSGRETAGSTAPGTASVSLRGLGATRTLVLVDGKRVPKDSITQAADLNLVPFAAVDRIEILKDSASAIYGSDALGGVVNIITRKNFTGTEVSLKQLVSQEKGGNQTEVSVTSGYSRDKLTVTGVLYHRNNQMIYARDRDHAKLGLSRTGSPGTFRTLKPNSSGDGYEPYTLDDGKTTAPQSRLQAAPGCPENRILDILGGQVCQFNYADHMSMRPRISQTSAMINSDFKVVDGLNTFVRMGATLRNVDWVYAPTPAGPTSGLGVSGAHAKTYIPGAEDPNGLNQAFANLQDTDFVDIRYRLLELGNRISKVATRQYSTLAGTTVEVGTSWEIELSTSYSQSSREDIGVSGYARKDALKSYLKKSFNPFASKGQRGDLSKLNYRTWATSKTNFVSTEILGTGEILELNHGAINMALGVQTYREGFEVDADEASKKEEIIGSAGGELSGDRSVVSAYAEMAVPVHPRVDWNLAGRFDSYSDFGHALSPQTSLRWQVNPHVMVRSSIGGGFKAPDLDDLYQANSFGWPSFIDRTLCAQEGGKGPACAPEQWLTKSSGNKKLKAEKSVSANIGTVFQPNSKLSLGVDAWYLKLDNQVNIDYEAITVAEQKFGVPYLVKNFGIDIERDTDGTILLLTAPLQNLDELETTGIDLSAEWKTDVTTPYGLAGWLQGRWTLGVQHSHLLSRKSRGLPGLDKENKLGKHGYPPWRNILALTYAPTNKQAGTLSVRTVAGYEKENHQAGHLKSYMELDLQYAYSGDWGGVISAGLRNVLGSTPPIDNSNPDAPGISHALYDGNGRIGWVQYKHMF